MRPMIRKSFALVLFIVVASAATPVIAGTCSWTTTPSAMAFGTYSVFSTADLPTSTRFAINCTPHSRVNVKMTTGSSGVFTPYRLMNSVAKYNIFLDPNGSQVWGDANAGTVTYDAYNTTPGNKDIIDFMYGIMPKGQDLAPGSYSDNISVTLSYGSDTGALTNSLAPITLRVSATVNPECRIDTFGLSFGTYSPLSATGPSASTSFKVYCTKTTSITSAALSSVAFQMSSTTTPDLLSYTAAMTVPPGSLTSTSSTTPIGGAGGFAINGSVPARQDVAVGAYADSLQATINY